MALISKRFENPGGRFVEPVPAAIDSYSTFFRAEHGSHYEPSVGNRGVGFTLYKQDGSEQHLSVYLTHAELDELIRWRKLWDEEYGRGTK